MRNAKQDFSSVERLMVVAILLLLAAIAVQNVLLSVGDSEEQTVKSATVEYRMVKKMYTAQNHAAPSAGFALGPTGAVTRSDAPDH